MSSLPNITPCHSHLPPCHSCGGRNLIREEARAGQVMLLTVLILGGVVLGASSIGGLLMLNQLKQANLVTDSTEAVFAADSGLEYALFTKFKIPTYPKPSFDRANFITTFEGTDEFMKFRSIGCSGSVTLSGMGCGRRANRSEELTFELVR